MSSNKMGTTSPYCSTAYHKLKKRQPTGRESAETLENKPAFTKNRPPSIPDWDGNCPECKGTLKYIDGAFGWNPSGATAVYGTFWCKPCHLIFEAEERDD
mmetsp:Transcript_101/g.167  ORF Transcript_101/g.167 Transcript_101/m.167 type:complete len:100 (-) Transcript_101:289-588(-)